jgi:ATP-binding cassette, subfamily B, bacterial PglK
MKSYIKSVLTLLDRSDRRYLIVVIFVMLSAMLLEMVSVASFLPFVKLLAQPSIINSNHYLSKVYSFFSFHSTFSFLLFCGCTIFLIIFTKGLFSLFVNYIQFSFTRRINNKLAKKIFSSYIFMEYSEYLNNNTADFSKYVLYDVTNSVASMSACLNLIANVFIVIGIVTLMVWLNPSIVMTCIVLLGLLFYISTRSVKYRLNEIAGLNEVDNKRAYRSVIETFKAIKEIKIFSTESHSIDQYTKIRAAINKQQTSASLLSNIPSIIINVFSFGMMLAVVLYLFYLHGSIVSILPLVGVFAICVQRLLPPLNVVSSSINSVRQYMPVVHIVADTIQKFSENKYSNENENSLSRLTDFNDSIVFKNVFYKYPAASNYALKEVSFSLKKNMTLGVVGASGAGKSTLIDIILGLYPVSNGSIHLDGQLLSNQDCRLLRKMISYVPQSTFLLDASIEENIAFGINECERNGVKIKSALKTAQLDSMIESFEEGVKTVIGENGVRLSGGQRQRIGIARALYRDRPIIIFDEATNALDLETEKAINDALKNIMHKKTIVIIAHRLSSIQFCDHIIQLDQGCIIASGTFDELILKSKSFNRMCRLDRLSH